MKRMSTLIVVVALALAACGGSGADPAPAQETPSPAGDLRGADSAPDFTLALGTGGGQFTLSAEQKPVYLVFWAEW